MTLLAFIGAGLFVLLVCYGAGTSIVGDDAGYVLPIVVGAVMIGVLILLLVCFVYTVRWIGDAL